MITASILIVMGILLFLEALLLLISWLGQRVVVVDAAAVTAQIMKLIQADNLPRAIKLCNVAPEAPFCQAAKNLLTVAKRPYRLELEYQTGCKSLSLYQKQTWPRDWLVHFIGFAGSLAVFAGFYLALSGTSKMVMVGLAVTHLLLFLALRYIAASLTVVLPKSVNHLTRIRNVLYLRNSVGTPLEGVTRPKYLPPPLRPRDNYTEEELAAWRESMCKFERRMQKRRDLGEDFDITEKYDETADPDGVLPAL